MCAMALVPLRVAIVGLAALVGMTAGACDHSNKAKGSGYRREMHRAMWTVRSAVDRTIHIVVVAGGCIRYDHTDVELHADSVRLRVWNRVGIPTDERHICPSDLNIDEQAVQLPEPLGTRTIVGACTPGESVDRLDCESAVGFVRDGHT